MKLPSNLRNLDNNRLVVACVVVIIMLIVFLVVAGQIYVIFHFVRKYW